MSRIAFIEMPAPGHVNPTLPIVRELVRRGEQVDYYVDEEFRAAVEATGATFHPYPAGVLTSAAIAGATQTGDMTRVPAVILRATETLLPFMVERLEAAPPDAIALDSNALWGHMAAKRLGQGTVSLMTTMLLGADQMARPTLREWLHMSLPILPGIPQIFSARSSVMKRFGKDAFPESPVFPAKGTLNLAFIPRSFQPDEPRVDESFRFVGPTAGASGGELPPELAGPEPMVYISLGTLHLGSGDLFRQCFEAFRDLPLRFVVATGGQADLGAVPPNFVVRPRVPQLAVLDHATAFITHAGMNSVLEGLSRGLPLLMVPQQLEQLLIAIQVAELGAGIALRGHMAGRRITAAELRPALELLLAEPRYRQAATAQQEALKATGGAVQAAEEIMAFARGARP